MADAPVVLPPPSGPVDVLIVAGEHSGDQHAARLLRDLQARRPGLRVAALGGPALQAAGAELLFDLTAHSVLGLVEVLKHYRFFKTLFEATVAWVAAHQPRVVVFVDYPGFNLRLAKALFQRGLSRKAGGPTALYYYISPQLWAWKQHRRFAMARHLDELGVIFPFETSVYADTELPVRFIGHPFTAADYEPPVVFGEGAPVLLLPGSRVQPVSRILPVMLEAFQAYRQQEGLPETARMAQIIVPDARVRQAAAAIVERFPALKAAVHLVPTAPGIAGVAVLTSSGTMSLACALAGLPGAIVYRAHPLTYLVGRRVVRIPYLGIANLILQRPAYPEYIQGAARAADLAGELRRAVREPQRREQARQDAVELRQALQGQAETTAADRVLSWLPAR